MPTQPPKNEKPGCLGRIQQILGLSPKAAPRQARGEAPAEAHPQILPYRLRDNFLSPAELNFYRVLASVVGDRVIICAKVSLGDLFYPKTRDYGTNTSLRNKIDRKHVDFLLCDPQTIQPLLGIELDDAGHRRPARQDRDQFVDQVFSAANLPLYRVPVLPSYNTRELAAAMGKLMGLDGPLTAQTAGPAPLDPTAPSPAPSDPRSEPKPAGSLGAAPACPKCGQPMVLRTVKRQGANFGKQFWGCPTFPKCRGVRALTTPEKPDA